MSIGIFPADVGAVIKSKIPIRTPMEIKIVRMMMAHFLPLYEK